MNYLSLGNGQDILFLHGWGQDLNCFKHIASYFIANFKVNLIDFEGFGKSKMPDKAKTITDYSLDVISFIKKHNLKNIILIGHSFGGRVAIELCSKYPQYFDKLVLVDSAGIKPKRKISYYIAVYRYKIRKKLNLNIEGLGSSDYKKLNTVMQQTFINVVNYYQDKLLKNITTKTLIISGKNDKETPLYMAKKLHKNIKNSKLVVMNNCGHFPFFDDIFNFIKYLNDFIYE